MKPAHIMITNTLFAAACALLIGGKSFAEPMNLQQLKNEVRTYQTSGAYDQEFKAVVNQAQAYIDQQVAANNQAQSHQKLAVVLDIDETSLSDYANMDARDFSSDMNSIQQGWLRAKNPAIQPMLALYKRMQQEGIAVFFVTGRREPIAEATKANLKNTGFTNWAGLYLRPTGDQSSSVIPFKTQARMAIAKAGYTVIASFGDQQSDLTGDDVGKPFKLPNPYYYVP